MKLMLAKPLLIFMTRLLTLACLAAAAQGDSLVNGEWFGDHVVQNGRTAIKGNIWVSQHVYYVGDEFFIRLDFPRGYNLIASGAVDAHVVVFTHAGRVFDIPIPADWAAAPRKFFRIPSIDIDEFPEGQYQLGLVLTVHGGDAKDLGDWYGGFRALLDSEAIYMASTPVDTDEDVDGEHDDDTDRDGINGEEADEVDDDVVR
jgi:hypothetical protein